MRRSSPGFTLVELLVVIAIIISRRARVFGRGVRWCFIYMESFAERQIGGSVQVGFRR